MTPEELRRAVRVVVADYEAFLARAPAPGGHEDAKAFAAFHAAARAALGHLEHLLKLIRSLAPPDPGSDEAEEDARLLTRARARIAEGNDHDSDEDDGDEGRGDGDGGDAA